MAHINILPIITYQLNCPDTSFGFHKAERCFFLQIWFNLTSRGRGFNCFTQITMYKALPSISGLSRKKDSYKYNSKIVLQAELLYGKVKGKNIIISKGKNIIIFEWTWKFFGHDPKSAFLACFAMSTNLEKWPKAADIGTWPKTFQFQTMMFLPSHSKAQLPKSFCWHFSAETT